MATKLKHLKVTSVDFVDDGSEPRCPYQTVQAQRRSRAEPGTEDPTPTVLDSSKLLSSSLAKNVWSGAGAGERGNGSPEKLGQFR